MSSCLSFGGVLTYYGFNLANTKYFAKYQKSTSDPYTVVRLGDKNDDVLRKAHVNFMRALRKAAKANNITEQMLNISDIAQPTSTVIAVWYHRDHASAINPSFSTLPQGGRYVADPKHAIRNRASKPLDDYRLFIGNEAYSGGEGWANPALILTERVVWQHFTRQKPAWVNVEGSHDCLTGLMYTLCARAGCDGFARTCHSSRLHHQRPLHGHCE